ncbi:uncharacterized protein MONOS_17992 [Monocercomonoides exilis]|uniref:uncharacterized protein n=1 Tax=Monocercomonoides exilis TaxID=2049356 RepID=UPI00355AA0F5|nr:hypothetical protein MONOS_17992 [Monocercomonoides exilis]
MMIGLSPSSPAHFVFSCTTPTKCYGSFCSSKEGRFEYEAPKVMIPYKVKTKMCVVWKEFRLFEGSSEREGKEEGNEKDGEER